MRRLAGSIACPLCFVLLPVRTAAAQHGAVRGHVADSTGTALTRAQVWLEGTAQRVTSDDRGDYHLLRVSPGSYTLRIRLLGYVPQSVRITVAAGEAGRQDFTLAHQPIGLAAIDVVVGSRARHTAAEELAVPGTSIPRR